MDLLDLKVDNQDGDNHNQVASGVSHKLEDLRAAMANLKAGTDNHKEEPREVGDNPKVVLHLVALKAVGDSLKEELQLEEHKVAGDSLKEVHQQVELKEVGDNLKEVPDLQALKVALLQEVGDSHRPALLKVVHKEAGASLKPEPHRAVLLQVVGDSHKLALHREVHKVVGDSHRAALHKVAHKEAGANLKQELLRAALKAAGDNQVLQVPVNA